jgi:hypothetical protein
MMVRQTFIKFYSTTGPVYSRVVTSEPRKAEDQLLLLSEVNYLKCSVFLMALGLEKHVDIILNGASSVFGPVNILYGDWGFQSVKAHDNFLSKLAVSEQTHSATIEQCTTWDSSPSVSELKKTIYNNGSLALFQSSEHSVC